MRSLALPIFLAALVFYLAETLAAADWLLAVPLGTLVIAGLFELAPPAAVAAPAPRSVATEAGQQGAGR